MACPVILLAQMGLRGWIGVPLRLALTSVLICIALLPGGSVGQQELEGSG